MMIRKRHPNKEIEVAVSFLEKNGWRYKKVGGSSHAWGRMLCPYEGKEGCAMSIWSTPRNPAQHVRQIMRCLRRCQHSVEIENA